MIYTTLDNFYLTDEELRDSPSRKDGVDETLEMRLRIYGCEIIQEACILLKLPQNVAATAQVLFHRFYCKHSMKDFAVRKLAPTCVWLSAKLEEQVKPGQTRQVMLVFDRIYKRRDGSPLTLLDFNGKEYIEMKAWLIKYERYLLRAFGFIMHVDHPHKFVLTVLEVTLSVKETKESPIGSADSKQHLLFQESWSLVNDRSETIGCGLIFLAARRLKIPLPENPPWWAVYNVKLEDMYEVCRVMVELYAQPKAEYVPLKGDRHQNKPATPIHCASPDSQQRQDGVSPSTAALEPPSAPPVPAEASPEQLEPASGPGQEETQPSVAEPAVDGRERHRDRGARRDRDGERDRDGDRDRDGERHRSRGRSDKGKERGRERDGASNERQREGEEGYERVERKRHRDRDDGDRDARRVRSRDRERDEEGEREARVPRSRDRERDEEDGRNPRAHGDDVERDGKSGRHRERDGRDGRGGRYDRDERSRRDERERKGGPRDRERDRGEERAERPLSDKKRARERERDYDPAAGEYREREADTLPLPPPPPRGRDREASEVPQDEEAERPRKRSPADSLADERRKRSPADSMADERPRKRSPADSMADERPRKRSPADSMADERPRKRSPPPDSVADERARKRSPPDSVADERPRKRSTPPPDPKPQTMSLPPGFIDEDDQQSG